MGRKRTSNKVNLMLHVDKDIIEKLNEWNVNKSALFTEKALELLKELEEEYKNSEKKDL